MVIILDNLQLLEFKYNGNNEVQILDQMILNQLIVKNVIWIVILSIMFIPPHIMLFIKGFCILSLSSLSLHIHTQPHNIDNIYDIYYNLTLTYIYSNHIYI